MSIPLKIGIFDLVNLIVAKGTNFLLTMLLFALVSKGMDSRSFGEFGYWWSVSIMIGGTLVGGLSSALVRVAAVHSSLRHLSLALRHTVIGLLVLAAAWTAAILVLPEQTGPLLLFAAIALFGLTVQAQTAILALLRAIEATRANFIVSLLTLLLVPSTLYVLLGVERELPKIFYALACSFGLSTIAAMISARRPLAQLLAGRKGTPPSVMGFLNNASSFTAVSLFSYAIVNIDFTLFRIIGTPTDFATMATGKIFFERFIVPALMIFSGVVSLRVLRHPNEIGSPQVRLDVHIGILSWIGALAMVALLTIAYWVFAHLMRGDEHTIPLLWVACASAGYLLYAFNGILLDVLVIQRPLATVLAYMTGLMLLGGVVQALAIKHLGLPGWAIGWLVLNFIVTAVLARNGLRVCKLGQHPTGN